MIQRKKHNSLLTSDEIFKRSMKDKRVEVERYLLEYKKKKIQLKCYDSLPALSQKKICEKNEIIAFISFIDTVLNSLSDESKEFFKMEYFTSEINISWWEGKYSKGGYMNIRNMAYSEFLMYVG